MMVFKYGHVSNTKGSLPRHAVILSMIGVSNHLPKRIVFRFHYHSQPYIWSHKQKWFNTYLSSAFLSQTWMFCETLGSTGLQKIHGWQMPNKNWKTSTNQQACSISGFCESVVYLVLWSFNAVTISCWSCWWELFWLGLIKKDFFQLVFSKQKSPGGDIWNGNFTLWINNLGCFKKNLSCHVSKTYQDLTVSFWVLLLHVTRTQWPPGSFREFLLALSTPIPIRAIATTMVPQKFLASPKKQTLTPWKLKHVEPPPKS